MIVLHHCVPAKNVFQIYRFDLEFFVDSDLLGGTGEERVKIVISYGRVRQRMRHLVIGPYRTDHEQMEELFAQARERLREKLKNGYCIAVAEGVLAERFRNDLMLVPRVKPWAMASAFEQVQERKRLDARAAQEKAYRRDLANQGQTSMLSPDEESKPYTSSHIPNHVHGFEPLPRRHKGPTPRSRQYEEFIRRLGQQSLFDDDYY